MDEIRKIAYTIGNIAHKLRHADKNFPDLPLEEKTMLNTVGKILGEVGGYLLIYLHRNEEEQLNIRKSLYRLKSCIEEKS